MSPNLRRTVRRALPAVLGFALPASAAEMLIPRVGIGAGLGSAAAPAALVGTMAPGLAGSFSAPSLSILAAPPLSGAPSFAAPGPVPAAASAPALAASASVADAPRLTKGDDVIDSRNNFGTVTKVLKDGRVRVRFEERFFSTRVPAEELTKSAELFDGLSRGSRMLHPNGRPGTVGTVFEDGRARVWYDDTRALNDEALILKRLDHPGDPFYAGPLEKVSGTTHVRNLIPAVPAVNGFSVGSRAEFKGAPGTIVEAYADGRVLFRFLGLMMGQFTNYPRLVRTSELSK
jgi:hypothetical protein